MNLANKLTIFRIILVPIMVIIPMLNLKGECFDIPITFLIIDLIFIIASITDKLDGYIARSRNQVTSFGQFLDPIADKILVLSAMIMLVELGRLPSWIPIIILFREFVVSGYRLVAASNGGKVIAASNWGKIKTVTQMVAVITAYFNAGNLFQCFYGNMHGFNFAMNLIESIMMIVCVFATCFSGWDYLKNGKDLIIYGNKTI